MQQETLAKILSIIPNWFCELMFIGRRPNIDGTKLNAKAQLVCRLVEKMATAETAFDVAANRQQIENLSALLGGKKIDLASVEDIILPLENRNIPGRLYKPEIQPNLPILLFFHGGGFIRGSIDSHDLLCRQLASHTGCAVLSVDYRLAPENKFPAAIDDAYDCLRWLQLNASDYGLDNNKIAIGGDSSGGNLATVACQMAKEKGTYQPIFQLLLYPTTNSHFSAPSHAKFAEGYFLTEERMCWFRDCYLTNETDRDDPRASPLLSEDVSGLAPALVITAGYDPLRDEAEEYARALKHADVPVGVIRYGGMVHGFMSMPVLFKQANDAIQQSAAALKSVLVD